MFDVNWQLGTLYKDGLDFDTSIKWMKKAHKLDPDSIPIAGNLATTMSRSVIQRD